MLMSRVITALILLTGFLLSAIYLPNRFFAVLILIVMGIAGFEWARLVGLAQKRAALAYGAGIFLVGALFWWFLPRLPQASSERVSELFGKVGNIKLVLALRVLAVRLRRQDMGWLSNPLRPLWYRWEMPI